LLFSKPRQRPPPCAAVCSHNLLVRALSRYQYYLVRASSVNIHRTSQHLLPFSATPDDIFPDLPVSLRLDPFKKLSPPMLPVFPPSSLPLISLPETSFPQATSPVPKLYFSLAPDQSFPSIPTFALLPVRFSYTSGFPPSPLLRFSDRVLLNRSPPSRTTFGLLFQ